MTWAELREKTAALTLRERGILFATLLLLVGALWFQFSFDGLLKQYQEAVKGATQVDAEILAQTEALVSLQARLSNDPNAPLRIERQGLEEELERVALQIESRLEHLVVPERMADLARQVLNDFKGLQLLGAENLPPTPLEINLGKQKPLAQASAPVGEESASEQVIFEHGFRLTLQGSYFNALQFIQRLEKIEGFYWRSLSYEVQQWPQAKIVIHVSTLSLDKEWIGV